MASATGETQYAERGLLLEKLRLQKHLVDVHFLVQGVRFPAHRLIVSLFSPVLHKLTSASAPDAASSFVEHGQEVVELKEVSHEHFAIVLTYIYTGRMALNQTNVFGVMSLLDYLQIEDKMLMDDGIQILGGVLRSQRRSCNVETIMKVWKMAFLPELVMVFLKELVMDNLELLCEQGLFFHMSAQAIVTFLTDPFLCIRQEKVVLDELMKMQHESGKLDKNDLEYILQFFHLPDVNEPESVSAELIGMRKCSRCSYVTLSKDLFLILRQRHVTHQSFHLIPHRFATDVSKPASVPKANDVLSMIDTGLNLIILAPSTVTRNKNTIYIFNYETESWSESMLQVDEDQLVYLAGRVYFINGQTPGSPINRCLYRVYETDLIQAEMADYLNPMPVQRRNFAATTVDQKRMFLIGHTFCDVYYIDTDSWLTFSLPRLDLGRDDIAPVVASLGTLIYVFGPRLEGRFGPDRAFVLNSENLKEPPTPINLSSEPLFTMGFEPKAALSHNRRIYVMGEPSGHQKTFDTYCYDPIVKTWELLLSLNGTFTPHGCLVRRKGLSEAVLDSTDQEESSFFGHELYL